MLLHPYQEAPHAKRPGAAAAGVTTPGWALFTLLDGLNEWLEGTVPYIQSSLQKNAVSVYVLYRNVGYLPEDFWALFASMMARVHSTWPICAFGTAENEETVRLTAQTGEDGAIHLVQQSISGKCAGMMKTLCLQIDCTDNETAERLARLLTATRWETGVGAMSTWQDAIFLREQGLLVRKTPPGLFCYGGVRQEPDERELLLSLDFGQKILLWTAFLKDGFNPAEFTWLSEQIAEGTLDNRLEWELTLWETLDQLDFRMVNEEKSFALFDSAGHRIYFSADGGSAAQRVFLKILFPLND